MQSRSCNLQKTPPGHTSVAFELDIPGNSNSSPITWLPAEDVLPIDRASNAGAVSVARYNGTVYSRRPRIVETHDVHPSEPDSLAGAFLNNNSKELQVILPTPKP
jgi:hypothetical protein